MSEGGKRRLVRLGCERYSIEEPVTRVIQGRLYSRHGRRRPRRDMFAYEQRRLVQRLPLKNGGELRGLDSFALARRQRITRSAGRKPWHWDF